VERAAVCRRIDLQWGCQPPEANVAALDDIFLTAVEKAPADRAGYLDAACGADTGLRAQVEALLRSHEEAGSLLEQPLFQPGPTVDQSPAVERPGTAIGPYKLVEQIGEGGMGTVWMAQQTEPVKRLVAVKFIKAGMDSGQVIARFEAERQALALMDHPNIARVLDAGTTDAGRPYFVMDLVKGMPITKYCDEHRLTPRERLELFVPVCLAVQHAHQKGIIHRDLKPSNVQIAVYDGRPVPKVIDFGVAKATGQSLTEKTLVTGFGAIVGTLEYMSPEQAEINQLDIDTRSDIYSLGVLVYELLTGSPPFTKEALEKAGMLEMLRVIREQEPSKPSTKLSTTEGLPTLAANRGMEPAKLTRLVRGELDWIVMKALEKDRNRRYETANGFAMDVQRYLADEAVLACPPSAGYRLRKFARKNRSALAGSAALAFLLLAGTAVSTWQAVRATRAETAANASAESERQATIAADREKDNAIHSAQREAGERVRAETARKVAEAKEAEANAVVTFFEDKVFAAGRPNGEAGGLGFGVTLRDAIKASLPALGTSFGDQPLVEARLRRTLGVTFNLLGDYAQAIAQTERARDLFTLHRGPDHRDTLRCMNNLGLNFAAMNRYADALKLREETLAIAKRALPPDDLFTLNCMNNLALSYADLNRHADAIKLHEEALAAEKRVLPPDDPDTLKTMHNLGLCFFSLNLRDKALKLHEETLAARRRVLPPDHPDTLKSMTCLAIIYAALNRQAEALKLREEAVAASKRVLPPDHPNTLACMSNLALSYVALNRYAEARKLFEETLATRKRVLPPDHPDTLSSMTNLANCYAVLNHHTEALPLREETLAAQKRVLPPDHPNTLLSMHNVAHSYAALNRHTEAIKLFEEALAAQKRVLPADHPDTLLSMCNLANSYQSLKRNAEALKLREETLAAQKRAHPADHPDIFASMHSLANSYSIANRRAEALKLREEALAGRRRVLPPDHPDTLLSMISLASSYHGAGRVPDAVELLQEALPVMKTKMPDHPQTILCMFSLAGDLLDLNRHAEAITLVDEMLAKADRVSVDPRLIPIAIGYRLRCCQKLGDVAGCRVTAEMWEKRQPGSAESLYSAASCRGVTAALQAKATDRDAARLAKEEADKAMSWLTKAVAAGFKDLNHLKKNTDLDCLREREDFKKLLTGLEKTQAAPGTAKPPAIKNDDVRAPKLPVF
jgi:eukaryotic-like serine/threonine-protein kinase